MMMSPPFLSYQVPDSQMRREEVRRCLGNAEWLGNNQSCAPSHGERNSQRLRKTVGEFYMGGHQPSAPWCVSGYSEDGWQCAEEKFPEVSHRDITVVSLFPPCLHVLGVWSWLLPGLQLLQTTHNDSHLPNAKLRPGCQPLVSVLVLESSSCIFLVFPVWFGQLRKRTTAKELRIKSPQLETS